MTTIDLENPAADLDNLLSRIGKSVNNDAATSANTARLREEATQMVAKIKAHADMSRARMLEPLLPRAQIEDAKRNAEAAAVDSQRLEAAIELLSARAADLKARELSCKKLRLYHNAQEHRDKIASQIKDRFPAIQAEYLAMIESIMQSNAEVDEVNADLPEGMPALERPEGVARGFYDHGSYETPVSFRTFRITQSLLPSADGPEDAAWPPVPDYLTGVQQRQKGFSQANVRALWGRRRP